MRRALLIAVLSALAVASVAQAQAPPLRAKVASCVSGPQAADRAVVFTASMPSIKGTRRMWIRFDLLARPGLAPDFAAVRVPGLGVWKKSAPGRSAGFVFTQRVQALTAPGAYKAVVHFRWYGRGGTLLRSARRETPICKQPDQRPDLRAGPLTATAGPLPDQATYSLALSNDGRTAAGAFDVLLSVAGPDQPAQRVADGLAAGARRTVTFVAPRCLPGSSVRFTLDARGEVDEVTEGDNIVTRPCPFAS
ncbi:MAG TPA: CARDB domain-containing protein [Solirubrobacteraceae bacterium]